MEEDRGSEKYSEVIILLFRVCTQLMRAVVTEQIDTEYASVRAKKRLGTFLFNKRTHLFPRGRSTHAQDATFENTLYPGYGESTDIDKWDLQLLAFVALRTCDQSNPTLMIDFEELKKIRNALCHSSDGILSDAVYDDYMLKVRTIFIRTLYTLKNSQTIGELNKLFKALEHGPNQMFCKYSKTRLMSWYQYDKRPDEVKLDRLDVGQENIVRKVDKSFHLLNKIHMLDGEDSMVDGATRMPETEVLINVKMCNPDQEKEISSMLVQLLDSELRNDTELVRELSEETVQRVHTAVKKALAKLSLNGYPLTKVQHGCVVLRLQSSSYAKLKELWSKAMDGTLTWVFRHVEAALKSSYPAVKLEVYISERGWWREMAELAEALENHTYRIAAKYDFARELTKQAVEETPDAYVKSAIIQKENLGMTGVSLKIAPKSEEHHLHMSEVCKNSSLDKRLKTVANALKDAYNKDTLEIEGVSTNKSQRFTEPETYQSTSEPPIRPVSCIAPRSAIKADQPPSVPSIHTESAGGRDPNVYKLLLPPRIHTRDSRESEFVPHVKKSSISLRLPNWDSRKSELVPRVNKSSIPTGTPTMYSRESGFVHDVYKSSIPPGKPTSDSTESDFDVSSSMRLKEAFPRRRVQRSVPHVNKSSIPPGTPTMYSRESGFVHDVYKSSIPPGKPTRDSTESDFDFSNTMWRKLPFLRRRVRRSVSDVFKPSIPQGTPTKDSGKSVFVSDGYKPSIPKGTHTIHFGESVFVSDVYKPSIPQGTPTKDSGKSVFVSDGYKLSISQTTAPKDSGESVFDKFESLETEDKSQ